MRCADVDEASQRPAHLHVAFVRCHQTGSSCSSSSSFPVINTVSAQDACTDSPVAANRRYDNAICRLDVDDRNPMSSTGVAIVCNPVQRKGSCSSVSSQIDWQIVAITFSRPI